MYHPTIVPYGAEAKDMVPSPLAYHKEKDEFFERAGGFSSFTQNFSNFIDDCPLLVEELKTKQNNAPKKSLLSKLTSDDTEKNEAIILEFLPRYDTCELTKTKKK